MNATITLKRHDTRPFLDIKLKDSDTVYTNLAITGVEVTFTMKDLDTGEIKINKKPCMIVDPFLGAIRYVWDEVDTNKAGIYQGEFQVVFPAVDPFPPAKMTYPISGSLVIVILEDFDNA